MASPLIYEYPPLVAGILRKRYKRFLADIELDSGELVTAHCANTGPMLGVCEIGSRVYLSRSGNPKRKLPFSWEMIQVNGTWVGVNTALPNRVSKLALEQQALPELAGRYTKIRSEVVYGSEKSRIDFLLTSPDQTNIYVEVKNTTLAETPLALFPDTVTTRGQKHLRELMNLPADTRKVMLYFINRGDCDRFAPGDTWDPEYGALLRQAIAAGVEVLPYRFAVSPEGIRLLGLASLEL
ncbi:MAG: DNA/RNA nuclease SfsA [Cyanobacteria bacterium P01_H01_bin.15]